MRCQLYSADLRKNVMYSVNLSTVKLVHCADALISPPMYLQELYAQFRYSACCLYKSTAFTKNQGKLVL